MARVNPTYVTVDMVDAQSFMRLSQRFRVMGVPMTLVNGQEQVVGAVPEDALLGKIRQVATP
jgi:predicted DsbA family dithiol-disulfide isomerase